ncbi:MAG TPA: type II secretion system protein, partial [Firmicutes bacterium]|nr:type II secretion system protein [Bacillota bacterium]
MRKARGGILITILVIFMIISLLITLLFSTIIYIQKRAILQIRKIDSKLIAEAGIEECLFKLNTGQMYYHVYEENFGNGKYEIHFIEYEDIFSIESAGHVMNGTNIVSTYRAKVKGSIRNRRYIINEYER